jgi:hypothetical protein
VKVEFGGPFALDLPGSFDDLHISEFTFEPGIFIPRRLIPGHDSELLTHVANNIEEELEPPVVLQNTEEWA